MTSRPQQPTAFPYACRLLAATALLLGLHDAARAETRVAAFGTPGAFQLEVNPVTDKVYVATGQGLYVIDGAANTATAVTAGPLGVPVDSLAVNPATNTIYVATTTGAVVAVDGATLAVTPLATGNRPSRPVVNPVTNEIYVPMRDDASVTVIDGATHATQSLPVGAGPIALNTVTNKAYMALPGQVVVIDGLTKASSSIPAGPSPLAIAVNPVTNKIYVTHDGGTVTAIDGATNATTTIPVGTKPVAIAVNPATNRIYVANMGGFANFGGDVTVIDGATGTTTTIVAGVIPNPAGLAVNVVTNTIYVRSGAGFNKEATAIDGATNVARKFVAGAVAILGNVTQTGIAVNPVTNTVYVSESMLGVDKIDARTHLPAAITTGANPAAVTANPFTSRVYVPNAGADTLTVIDEVSGTTTDVPVGSHPRAVAYNPVTNRIYVANSGSDNVSVIDGTTNAVLATVATGAGPVVLAVNPSSNRIYVVNQPHNSVTVIDGLSHATSAVPVGVYPAAVAVNLATNRIYVANSGSNSVTVIDGDSLATRTVATGANPFAVAVDAARNTVYVANYFGNSVTVIDGASLSAATVAVGAFPRDIAVDTIAGKAYVANSASHTVIEIDAATRATVAVPVGLSPLSLAVNPVTRRVYVANDGSVSVIDVATRVVSTLPTGTGPARLALNPVTERIYVAKEDGTGVIAIRASSPVLANHDTDVSMAGGSVTSSASATLSLAVCCAYAPFDPPVRRPYVRAGDETGVFAPAAGAGPYTATVTGLLPGLNFVKAFALDAMEGTSLQSESATITGAPTLFPLLMAPPWIATGTVPSAGQLGAPYNHVFSAAGGSGALTFTVSDGTLPPGLTLSPTGVLSGTPTQAGFFTFTVTVTDANGGTTSSLFAMTTLASDAPRLGNVSTRMKTFTGNDVLIGGFVIGGSTAKTVVVRARGPSLAEAGIAAPLANPTLQLVRSSDQATVATNDDWQDAGNAAALTASGFAPAQALESALLVTLAPGAYTAIVQGAGGASGVAIVEVFEVDNVNAPLLNISTRGQVLTGEDVMIGGFVVQGSGPQKVVIRARGPSLADYGIANPLMDPVLQLARSSDGALIAANDDWASSADAGAISVSGFAPSVAKEAAILVTLQPGAYTAIVTGALGGTGVGIVEVFTVPTPVVWFDPPP